MDLKRKNQFSLKKNIGCNIIPDKNIKAQNMTIESGNKKNDKNKRLTLASLKFNENVLVKILKQSKFKIKTKGNKKRNDLIDDNKKINNRTTKRYLSEKFRNIPGIDKLKYLTNQSMNELIRSEEKINFESPSITLNNKQNKTLNFKYKPKVRTQENLNTLNSSFHNRFKAKKSRTELTSLTLNLSNHGKVKYENNIINNRFSRGRFMSHHRNNKLCINDCQLDINNQRANTEANEIFNSYRKHNITDSSYNNNLYLYTQPNHCFYKAIYRNIKSMPKKTKLNKNFNRMNSFDKSKEKINNLIISGKKKSFVNNYENNKSYIPYDDENNKFHLSNIQKSQFLNRSSKIDRLIFKLENPNGCFEENVFSLKAGDKYISFKNQIIRQRKQIEKIFYKNKKSLISDETLIKKYIYKLYSDTNKKYKKMKY